jgi:hypothetical protein
MADVPKTFIHAIIAIGYMGGQALKTCVPEMVSVWEMDGLKKPPYIISCTAAPSKKYPSFAITGCEVNTSNATLQHMTRTKIIQDLFANMIGPAANHGSPPDSRCLSACQPPSSTNNHFNCITDDPPYSPIIA